jgi:hypothetical protein
MEFRYFLGQYLFYVPQISPFANVDQQSELQKTRSSPFLEDCALASWMAQFRLSHSHWLSIFQILNDAWKTYKSNFENKNSFQKLNITQSMRRYEAKK